MTRSKECNDKMINEKSWLISHDVLISILIIEIELCEIMYLNTFRLQSDENIKKKIWCFLRYAQHIILILFAFRRPKCRHFPFICRTANIWRNGSLVCMYTIPKKKKKQILSRFVVVLKYLNFGFCSSLIFS